MPSYVDFPNEPLQIQYWSSTNSEWVTSSQDGRTAAQLHENLVGTNGVRRVRFAGSDWEFFSHPGNPHRYTNRIDGRDGCFWSGDCLPDRQADYPILDQLTREVFQSPPSEKDIIMTSADSAAIHPLPPTRENSLVDIQIKRHEGKLILSLNAKPLHDLLDSIGCRTETTSAAKMYLDRPPVMFAAIRDGKLSTDLFLRQEYPVRLNLAQHFTRPASMRELRELCESAHAAVRTILEHYKPVDISYTIQKLVK